MAQKVNPVNMEGVLDFTDPVAQAITVGQTTQMPPRFSHPVILVRVSDVVKASAYQMRVDTLDVEKYEKDRELVESVRQSGVLEPIGVQEIPRTPGDLMAKPKYQIVFGHRRFAAAEFVGLEFIPAMTFSQKDDVSILTLAENIGTRVLTAFEYSKALDMLIKADNTLDPQALSKKTGIPVSSVYQYISAFDNICPALADLYAGGMSARNIVDLKPAFAVLATSEKQQAFAKELTEAGVSFNQVMALKKLIDGNTDPFIALGMITFRSTNSKKLVSDVFIEKPISDENSSRNGIVTGIEQSAPELGQESNTQVEESIITLVPGELSEMQEEIQSNTNENPSVNELQNPASIQGQEPAPEAFHEDSEESKGTNSVEVQQVALADNKDSPPQKVEQGANANTQPYEYSFDNSDIIGAPLSAEKVESLVAITGLSEDSVRQLVHLAIANHAKMEALTFACLFAGSGGDIDTAISFGVSAANRSDVAGVIRKYADLYVKASGVVAKVKSRNDEESAAQVSFIETIFGRRFLEINSVQCEVEE